MKMRLCNGEIGEMVELERRLKINTRVLRSSEEKTMRKGVVDHQEVERIFLVEEAP